MSQKDNPEELIDFPCQYTFKAIGSGDVDFSRQVAAVARTYAQVPDSAVHVRPSAKGNYQSVSIRVQLENYQQLQNIYAGMKKVSGLKMLL